MSVTGVPRPELDHRSVEPASGLRASGDSGTLEQSFGLREAPFSVTPDAKFVYLSPRHTKALAGLTFAILSRKRFILLTGDVGTGKTTLVTTALEYLPAQRTQFSVILNPTLSAAELLEAALSAFQVTGIPVSKVRRLSMLAHLLERNDQQGKVSTLIIDEAHKMKSDALEEIRLLGNLPSLQIVLVGQNELIELLNREDLRALKQRIALRLSIEPLSAAEVGHYISYRWTKAGGTAAPFSGEAVALIARQSRGIPRLINTICDNAMTQARQEQATAISVRHIFEASKSLDLVDPRIRPAAGPSAEDTESNGNHRWGITTISRLLVRKDER
jgi:general secretion pathway protein A